MLDETTKNQIRQTVLQAVTLATHITPVAYGIEGIAKALGCSKAMANKIKASGIIDPAIYQRGKLIAVDVIKANELYYGIKIKL